MGFNVEAFGKIADAVSIPVIAAGGLAMSRTSKSWRRAAMSGTPDRRRGLGPRALRRHDPAGEALLAAAV